MKFVRIIIITSYLCVILNGQLNGQVLAGSKISGSFETRARVYTADSAIDAVQPREVFLSNSYFNLNYTVGNFTAGVRFEAYLNTLEGYPNPENASGVYSIRHQLLCAHGKKVDRASVATPINGPVHLKAHCRKDPLDRLQSAADNR